jgi:hypothetical protein
MTGSPARRRQPGRTRPGPGPAAAAAESEGRRRADSPAGGLVTRNLPLSLSHGGHRSTMTRDCHAGAGSEGRARARSPSPTVTVSR